MLGLSKSAHLLDCLRAEIFRPTGHGIPLTWTDGLDADRARRLVEAGTGWAPVTPETIWGTPQRYFWFAGRWTVPEDLDAAPLWLRIDAAFGRVMGRSDPQCLVRLDGRIVQGADFNHREVLLSQAAKAGRRFDVLIEAGTIEDRRQLGFGLSVLHHDAAMEALVHDIETPLTVARHLPETDHRRDFLLATISEALNAVDLRPGDPARRAASITAARAITARIPAATDTQARPEITVTGHTHIDVAWLWRVRETRQKMARSMATALALMDAYPDYRFMYNQGYLLDALEQDYPELHERLKQAQARGQFEIEGALWLEPDANLAGGEALVRQILRGVRYHLRVWGVRPRLMWLPDTFGYAASLPQIMAGAGITFFITHKMSWNDTNRMPFETFFWRGIDGTLAPTYFLTTQPMESTSIGTTYCPDLTASHVMGAWRRHGQKDTNDALFLVYGHGDGGGGPTRDMLQRIRRMEAGVPGCPRVVHAPMGPFFEALGERMAAAPERFPVWSGELYLEFHRGTYTSVAEVKRNNRQAEAMLREVECLACLAMVRAGAPWPGDELAELWGILLLNQFHDILPGSSIGEVYDDSRADFARFFALADQVRRALSARLGGPRVVMNPTSTARRVLLAMEGGQPLHRADGTITPSAPVGPVPALGALVVARDLPGPPEGRLDVAPDRLENNLLRVLFDANGRLTSLLDKRTGREMLAGPGNRLQAFRDRPAQFDAWDIDADIDEQVFEIDRLISAEVVERGPWRAAIRLEWAYEASRLVQVVSLEAGAGLVEFDTFIDWHEHNTLVKAAFPLALNVTESRAEIPFGHITRPTHRNTTWDAARFETPMQRFVSLAEPGLGVALLNDCKYGYDAKGSTLRLTVLRSPTWPWPQADQGTHRLRYALMPHDGDMARVSAAAEAFNHPLEPVEGGSDAPVDLSPLVAIDHPAIVPEALKKAEDGPDLILRLSERAGARAEARLRLAAEIVAAFETDLVEESARPLAMDGREVILSFGPFQIRTLRLVWRVAKG